MARNPMTAAYVKGASSSLNKSIAEIDTFLTGHGVPMSPGPLRDELHDKLADLAQKWYRRGFSRGHRESRATYLALGKVPKKLRAKVGRNLFAGKRRILKLKSTIK